MLGENTTIDQRFYQSLFPGFFDQVDKLNPDEANRPIEIVGVGIAGVMTALALLAQGYTNITFISPSPTANNIPASLAALGQGAFLLRQEDLPEGVTYAEARQMMIAHYQLLEGLKNSPVTRITSIEHKADQYIRDHPEAKNVGNDLTIIENTFLLDVPRYHELLLSLCYMSGNVSHLVGSYSIKNRVVCRNGVPLETDPNRIFFDCTAKGLLTQRDTVKSGITLFLKARNEYLAKPYAFNKILGGNSKIYPGLKYDPKRNLLVISSARPGKDPYYPEDLLDPALRLIRAAKSQLDEQASIMIAAILLGFYQKQSVSDENAFLPEASKLFLNTSSSAKVVYGLRYYGPQTLEPEVLRNGTLWPFPAQGGTAFSKAAVVAAMLVKKMTETRKPLTVSRKSTLDKTLPSLQDFFPDVTPTVSGHPCSIDSMSSTSFLLALFAKQQGYDSIIYFRRSSWTGFPLTIEFNAETLTSHIANCFNNSDEVTHQSLRLLTLFSEYPSSGITRKGENFTLENQTLMKFLRRSAISHGIRIRPGEQPASDVTLSDHKVPIQERPNTIRPKLARITSISADQKNNGPQWWATGDHLSGRYMQITITPTGVQAINKGEENEIHTFLASKEPRVVCAPWIPGIVYNSLELNLGESQMGQPSITAKPSLGEPHDGPNITM